MNDTFDCGACRTVNYFSRYVRSLWAKPQPVKCTRCGCAYSVVEGDVSRISPDMWPIHQSNKRSPWMPTSTRPVVEGEYELRFRDTEPVVLRAWWNGYCFTNGDRIRITMTTFLTWRGAWA